MDEEIRILYFLNLTDIIHSGESLFVKKDVKMPVQGIAYSHVVFVSRPNSDYVKMAMLATVRTSIKVQILPSGFQTISGACGVNVFNKI